jgi:hypothetical protein
VQATEEVIEEAIEDWVLQSRATYGGAAGASAKVDEAGKRKASLSIQQRFSGMRASSDGIGKASAYRLFVSRRTPRTYFQH